MLFEKIIVRNAFDLKIMNFHKVIFVAYMIAYKFLDDNSNFIIVE